MAPEITEVHDDGTPHVPDWSTLVFVEINKGGTIFDVWCTTCGQSGSFILTPEDLAPDIQWYP